MDSVSVSHGAGHRSSQQLHISTSLLWAMGYSSQCWLVAPCTMHHANIIDYHHQVLLIYHFCSKLLKDVFCSYHCLISHHVVAGSIQNSWRHYSVALMHHLCHLCDPLKFCRSRSLPYTPPKPWFGRESTTFLGDANFGWRD